MVPQQQVVSQGFRFDKNHQPGLGIKGSAEDESKT
jgi:hypothetical protein